MLDDLIIGCRDAGRLALQRLEETGLSDGREHGSDEERGEADKLSGLIHRIVGW